MSKVYKHMIFNPNVGNKKDNGIINKRWKCHKGLININVVDEDEFLINFSLKQTSIVKIHINANNVHNELVNRLAKLKSV